MAVELFIEKKFWSKVKKTSSCWNWIGNIRSDGYGQLWYNGKPQSPHRLSYENTKGKIPEELVINHICRNRHCVNPDHLEVITRGKNIQIGISANRNKSICLQGHEYNEENTYIRPASGFRQCRICQLTSKRKYNRRKRLEKFT